MGKKHELENKSFSFEVKELTEEGQFSGYCAIFDKPDVMGETIQKGAFTKTLNEKDFFPMCWYHDPRIPLGIAYLIEDDKGLKVKGELNLEVQDGREKYALMKQKAIRGLSFSFKTIKDVWEGSKRYIKEVKLYEVSPCTFQAHPQALIGNVKQEDVVQISLDKALTFLIEYKSGKVISSANLKLLNSALQALAALLKATEPSKDTQKAAKSLYASVIKGLEPVDKPHLHLFGSTIKNLEK